MAVPKPGAAKASLTQPPPHHPISVQISYKKVGHSAAHPHAEVVQAQQALSHMFCRCWDGPALCWSSLLWPSSWLPFTCELPLIARPLQPVHLSSVALQGHILMQLERGGLCACCRPPVVRSYAQLGPSELPVRMLHLHEATFEHSSKHLKASHQQRRACSAQHLTGAGACRLDSSPLSGCGWRLCPGSAGPAQAVCLVNAL